MPWQAEDADLPLPAAAPNYAADPADIAAFRRDGAVLLKGVFADWVEPLARGLERNLAEPEAYAFPCESTAAGEAGPSRAAGWATTRLIPKVIDNDLWYNRLP